MNSCASTLLRRVRAAVEDVHHRDRHDARHRPAEVAVERQADVVRRRPRHRERHREDRVGAELALVGGAVERPSSRLSTRDLVRRAAIPSSRGPISSLTFRTASATPLPRVALRVAVPQLRGLVSRRWRPRSARRRGRCAPLDRTTSASTVGLPRLSRISRAWTSMMVDMNGKLPGFRATRQRAPRSTIEARAAALSWFRSS